MGRRGCCMRQQKRTRPAFTTRVFLFLVVHCRFSLFPFLYLSFTSAGQGCKGEDCPMSSYQFARPSDGALRTALKAVLTTSQPPTLVPHPPARNVAWRPRRIVEELKALRCVEALSSFEAELRGLVGLQETRCRTKLVNRAYRDECALREVEHLLAAEAAQRRDVTKNFFAIVRPPFEVLHLCLQEELTRRSLRCEERSIWRALQLRASGSRLGLTEADNRAALGALEEFSRDELRNRRLIELGDNVQREIVVQSCLAGHLRCVDHSKGAQRVRRRLQWQEEIDRATVERLYSLHLILLLQDMNVDFAAAVKRDVVLLSEASRATTQQVRVADCEECVLACLEQEQRLRLTLEEQEHTGFKAVTQAFLLGWRGVYKQITKDSDVTSVFGKIELLVRRDIVDRRRVELGSLLLAFQAQTCVLKRHQAERRSLCQQYIGGARFISTEENREANQLFCDHHVWECQQATLHRATVLAIEEVASSRAIRGAEAQARLACKLKYLAEKLQLQCEEGRQRVAEEEERCLGELRERYVHIFFIKGAGRLFDGERAERMLIEVEESAAAVDTLLPLRQALTHSLVSDACRPLSRLEDEFRARVTVEEARERCCLVRQHVLLSEAAHRIGLFELEHNFWIRHITAQVSAMEADARRLLCSSAEAEMLLVRQCVLEDWEWERRKSIRKCEVLVRESLAFTIRSPARPSLSRLTDATDMWGALEADWGDAASDVATWTANWPLHDRPSLTCYSTLRCEDVLLEAYLERDLIHFMEHCEWLQVLHHTSTTSSAAESSAVDRTCWKLDSLSMRLEPQQRAASINVWHSNQSFDVSFQLTQQPDEAIVGERTISFYAPDAGTTAALMQRDTDAGMVFFLILDDEGTVLACATMVVEVAPKCSAHLCIPLDSNRGFVRLV
ncbi:conserved hypothetical protein [Leishmania infantum JPCM5]|uniref:Uncharacterized protein n=1 Tax=Leishmania infantum TaxID=5671 RepID=A4ICX6_LEIIN|nr:conserved hypothetical protein [Leishmania infantum JPCM5]CAM72705.1 conserved hypothetical protein [Leishmania infantum JPCM5]|eukprot:XP_001469595.1 conserved hypothetical protein [Leishmania infantum JPCM5]